MVASKADPFLLQPHTVLSCSGGRPSMYMLWRTLQANGGQLPPDAVAIFNNTGKEREETLEFVEECSQRWGVSIQWLEYRYEPGKHTYVMVDYRTASRNGEPFRAVIEARGFLPNVVARFCTVEMKIRTSNRFVRQHLGWEKYRNAVGLRADEPRRVQRLVNTRTVTVEQTLFGDQRVVKRGSGSSPGATPCCPLAEAGVTNEDVLRFWSEQPFDLRLPVDPKTGKTLGGNCDLCFLKGTANVVDLIRQHPESADWWIEAETWIVRQGTSENDRFRYDRPSYAELKRIALGMVDEPGWLWADREAMACGAVAECNCTD